MSELLKTRRLVERDCNTCFFKYYDNFDEPCVFCKDRDEWVEQEKKESNLK